MLLSTLDPSSCPHSPFLSQSDRDMPASLMDLRVRGVSRPPRAGGTELYRTGSVTCISAPEVFCGLDLSWVGVAHTDCHLRAFAHIVLSPGVTPLCPPFIWVSNYDPPFILICTEVPG